MLAVIQTRKARSNRTGKVEGSMQEVERRFAVDTLDAIRKATAIMAKLPDEVAFRTQFTIQEV